jgi:uncharacterized coiled-coil protein SlyX
MTESGGLEEAILLRMVDRLVMLEQQTATNLATVGALTTTVTDLRRTINAMSQELDELRDLSTAAMHSFDEMRKPLQGLLDLKQRFSGGWIVAMGVCMVFAYLLQPLLTELYRWRFGLR